MKLNMALFSEKHNSGKEVKIYNNLQQLDSIHDTDHLKDDHIQSLAKYIHDNYDTMDELEMRSVAMKCLELNEIRDILLTFEFNNYESHSIEMTIEKFIKIALRMFKKYHRISEYLEDSDWIVHRSDSPHFEVGINEVTFQNTVDNADNEDSELNNYLYKMVEKLDNIASNIDVSLEMIEKKKITYVLIWAKLNNAEDECVVGL
jgi:hypothetical protein